MSNMSRRNLITSSDAAISIAENATLSHLLEEQLSLADPPEVTLRKALSVTSAISTASSLAKRHQEAASDPTALQKFRIIGQGSFGTVYELTGTTYIFKGEIHPNPTEYPLWKELLMHKGINEAFDKMKMLGIRVHIPMIMEYIREDNLEWWQANMEKFAGDHRDTHERCDLIKAERIFPIPEIIRQSLIDLYCPDAIKSAARASKANKDCLIRLYLGKDINRLSSRFFSLRNFRLHKNQMENLGLNLTRFAEAMGEALAILHWIAGTDARDVEFVLGSFPTGAQDMKIPCLAETSAMPPRSNIQNGTNFGKRSVHIWCLDFNQVRPITLDTAGVQMCVDAFFDNDPYYPRPGSTELWATFSESYLATMEKALQKAQSFQLLDPGNIQKILDQDLARRFITGVETRWLEKQEAKK